jgi:glycosyltransferase involved in cell wall biosynthesis
MSDSPLFSIIMPVYNRLDLARTAIESVSGQSDRDFEYIVVDDGSEESVRKELRALSSEYGFTLICQENAGPGAARNRGVREARGEYLVFLDSDDSLYPWALETYREIVRECDRPSLIGARFFPIDFEAPPDVQREAVKFDRYPDFLACSRGESFLGACNQIVRKDIFDKAGGFTSLPINCEDHDFILRVATEPGFVRIQSPPTLAYRIHEDNLTAVSQKTLDGIQFLLQQEQEGNYPGGKQRRRERHRILSKHVRPVSFSCLAGGDARMAWSLYRQTLFWNLALGQWKYLIGFPLRAAKSSFT